MNGHEQSHDSSPQTSHDHPQDETMTGLHQGHEMGEGQGSHQNQGSHNHHGHEITFRNRFWICLVLSIPVIIYSPAIQGWFGYSPPEFPGSPWIVPVFASIIFYFGGLPFLRMATWELRDRQPGMMTLISLAVGVAYFYSMATLIWGIGEDFFWELVTLIDVMLLGHWMEMRSVRQAAGALDALAQLMPDTAEVVMPDGSIMEHRLNELKLGEIVLIRPGANAPADGLVIDGRSEFNEAMLTGESKPVTKGIDSPIIAGTINSGNGSLRVRLTAVGADTALSGIMRLVEEAQQSKSPTQLLADRAASFLFYAALVAAALTAIVWTTYYGSITTQVIARVVTVLVIACPHALGLAVPLVVANTTSIAAKNGILIRDRQAIETAKDLNVIIFDKTGTLTKGEIGVVQVATNGTLQPDEALAITAAAEMDSEHLIAQAIRQAAEEKRLDLPVVTDFQVLKGRGVQGKLETAQVFVGGPRLLEFLALSPPPQLAQFAQESGQKGQSVIFLVLADEVVGAVALADRVRVESQTAVEALHDLDMEVMMLTGDSREVAAAIADELAIDHIFAEVLPADKDQKIVDLQKQGKRVGMVGDGVNDAPALTRADVGIAIGSGTNVAVESAGLILVNSNPLDVVKIIQLSNGSYRKQKENIWWAAGYNILMIPLAAGILAPWGFIMPPALGAFFMSLSTVIVAINAQTLRSFKFN